MFERLLHALGQHLRDLADEAHLDRLDLVDFAYPFPEPCLTAEYLFEAVFEDVEQSVHFLHHVVRIDDRLNLLRARLHPINIIFQFEETCFELFLVSSLFSPTEHSLKTHCARKGLSRFS